MDHVERIRELREDNDKTQKEIAEYLGIAQRTVAGYEQRRIRIPVNSLIKLAKFYNVDMNYICGLTHEKQSFQGK